MSHPGRSEMWGECSLCQRTVPPELLTLHHLRPRQKGGVAEDRTPMCIPCHKQIHAVFTNTELAQSMNSIDRLRHAPQLQTFMRWIVRQKPDRSFRTRASKQRKSARR